MSDLFTEAYREALRKNVIFLDEEYKRLLSAFEENRRCYARAVEKLSQYDEIVVSGSQIDFITIIREKNRDKRGEKNG